MSDLVTIDSNRKERALALAPSGIDLSSQPHPPRGRIGSRTRSLLAPVNGTHPACEIPEENRIPLPVGVEGARARVETPDTFPWRLVCRLEIACTNIRLRHATGWIAGPKLILTDSRSVYPDGWAEQIAVYIAGRKPVVCREFSRADFSGGMGLGALHLAEALPEEHGFFSAVSSEGDCSEIVNVAGYAPELGVQEIMQCQVPVRSVSEESIHSSAPVPDSLAGAPAFGVDESNVPVAFGWTSGGKHVLSRIFPTVQKVIAYWNGANYTPPKIRASRLKPERIPDEKSPQLLYLTGDVNNEPPSETKRLWDTLLFGNPVGCDSSLFYYRNLLPATDVPLVPGANIVDGILDSAKGRYGKEAVKFFKNLTADIEATDDNALLFGVTNALNWLNLALAYFFPFVTKNRHNEKEVVSPCRKQDIQNALLKELENYQATGNDVVVITHGFGSVILYDALTNASTKPLVKQVIALANPLAYSAIRKMLNPEAGEALPLPRSVDNWLDIAIPVDPIAADAPAFPSGTPNYHFHEDSKVRSEVLKRDISEAYLRLPVLKDFLSALLPRSFGTPVGDFVFAKDVADRMSERTIRVPTLIELDRTALEGDDTLQRRAEELVELILRAADPTGHSVNMSDLRLDVMKRYVAADLYADDLKRLQILSRGTLTVKRVWQNTDIRSLVLESAKIVHAEAARRTYDAWGEGIDWAVLDSGIDSEHKHFKKFYNIVRRWDFTGTNVVLDSGAEKGFRVQGDLPDEDTVDPSGHGTHVAAIIAGAGIVGDKPISGIAPKTRIHDYRVLDDVGRGRESSIIRALEHIYEVNAASQNLIIHGVNLSLGCASDPSVYGSGHSPICRELRRLWSQGVMVCVAAGNAGMISLMPHGALRKNVNVNLDISIGDPANLEECIAVGSVHKLRPHTYGISYFSSRGPTPDGRMKPDCVAPGERILSADAGGTHAHYREFSGTSMACPHVSGVVAAFLSRKREFIGQPDVVKKILLECCIDINRDRYHQGAGIPNLMAMLSKY